MEVVLWNLEKAAKMVTTAILVILSLPAVIALAVIVLTQWSVNKAIEWLRQKGWVS